MKQTLYALAFIMVVTSFVFAQSQANTAKTQSKDEQEILKVRGEWYEAYYRRDAAALKRIETSDFGGFTDTGFTNKRNYENFEKAAKENRVMPKGTALIDDEIRVRINGDMAVVSAIGWTKVPGQAEQPPASKTARTEVWVKRDGRWQVMHLHFQELKTPQKPQ